MQKAVLSLIILIFFACAPVQEEDRATLGKIAFSVTGKAEALPYFEKGLLLLHSFEYVDAAEEFQQARALDPDMVMAYWGEAMTKNHPLWSFQDYEKATEILNTLAPDAELRVARAATPLEQDFVGAVNILFGKGGKYERDSAYAAFLGELYQKYPGNDEVAAFYSISLIGSVPYGRDVAVYEHAAEIAKEVLARNPEHPGALHYLIHAYDDPDHAAHALSAADAYAVVAPDAGHALHMPSHIYLASGMWDKVISSNIAAWDAGLNRMERKQLTNDALNYHAFHWLLYGYLQQGRTEDARRLVHAMQEYTDALPSERARAHMVYLKTTYVVDTEDYTGAIASIKVDQSDLSSVTRAAYHFTTGMHAFHTEDADGLDAVITRMQAERLRDEEGIVTTGARMCAGITSSETTALDLQQVDVMILELKAMHAWMRRDTLATENFLRQATEQESRTSYAYGPPSIVKPSWELYGEWLVEMGRTDEALQQFEKTLSVHPGRALALQGKENAGVKM